MAVKYLKAKNNEELLNNPVPSLKNESEYNISPFQKYNNEQMSNKVVAQMRLEDFLLNSRK